MRSFLIALFTTVCLAANAQSISWLATAPVAEKMFGNLHPRIKLDKFSNPMVVWADEAGHAYFSKWGGESFYPPVMISRPTKPVFATSWAGPDIAAHGDTVYVVYKEMPEETGHIYIKHSFDGGVHFSAAVQVDTAAGDYISRFPTVSADENGNPFVTFMKVTNNYEAPMYYVARSDDMGETFFRDTLAVPSTTRVCECSPASLVASGKAGILLYRNNIDGLRNIWASISNNGSSTFNVNLQMDSTLFYPMTCPASGPDGVIVGDTLYSVFTSGRDENALVYLSKLSLSNPSLTTAPVTGNIVGVIMQNMPRISGMGYAAGVVWTQTSGGNNLVCLSITHDLTTGFPPNYDTVARGVMLNADVALGGGFVYVVWEDHETRSVMYRRGVYIKKKKEQENTSMLIGSQNANAHYFTINMPDLISVSLIDSAGNDYEMDISYPKSSAVCQVSTVDMEEGTYGVKAMDSNGRTYNARIHLKVPHRKQDDE